MFCIHLSMLNKRSENMKKSNEQERNDFMLLDWFINIWIAVGCLLGIFVLIATVVLILSIFKDM